MFFFYPSKYIVAPFQLLLLFNAKMRLLLSLCRGCRHFSRCTVPAPLRPGVELVFTPFTPSARTLREWVCPRYCEGLVTHTHTHTMLRSQSPHTQTAESWGRQVEETTLNGSTMTSRTPPGEEKF